MAYENKHQPLAPRPVYYRRQLYTLCFALVLLSFCLAIGIAGYHFTDGIPWIDSLHNAAMILSGMGPVITLKSTSAKLFSSGYALFSGVAFITNIGIILAPAAHRIFHKFHLQDK